MQTLFLRALILLFVALAVSAAHSWNTGVVLHLQPQDDFDWASLEDDTPAPQPGPVQDPKPDPEPPAQAEGAKPEGPAQGEGDTTIPADPGSESTSPLAEKPVEPRGEDATPQPQRDRPGAGSDPYITVEQARRLFDRQFLADGAQVIFVDARARTEYEKGHIEGAMSLPAGDFGASIPAKARDWLPGTAIVIYCQGAECTDSHDVARRLQSANLGIARIFIFKAGYPAWVDAGHPTMTGPDIIFGP